MLNKYNLIKFFSIGLLIITACCFLSGCSKYDERSALTPVLYFEKNGKAIVFSIIRYGKTVSYKSNGSSTYKQLNTSYFIQANNAETGEVIASKKIKHSSDIKYYPITVMGKGDGRAWVFMGELMAFDPLTLEKFADKDIIESKNPELKGKLPDDKSYYSYDDVNDNVLITANDGIKYVLSTKTLKATATDENKISGDPIEIKQSDLKQQLSALDLKYRANFDRYRSFNKLYSEKKISYAAYLDSGKNFDKQQNEINDKKNSLRTEMSNVEVIISGERSRLRQIENLKSGSKSYTAICTAVDTFKGKWYGLLSTADAAKPDSHFRYITVGAQTSRNRFYNASASIEDSTKKAGELKIGVPQKINEAVYLQGGFLLDKATALPIHLTERDDFIICYKDKIGSEGKIIIASVNVDGTQRWTLNTNLTAFLDWIYTGKQLIILGHDNKGVSSGEATLLQCVNLQNGKVVKYDYFANAMRNE